MSRPTLNVNLNYNNIYLGDSFELCEQVEAQTVDLILEDMPYNTTACDWDVKIDLELYWKTRLRILKPTGCVVLTATQPFTTDLISSNRTMFKQELVWDKGQGNDAVNSRNRHMKAHENIVLFSEIRNTYNPIITDKPQRARRFKPKGMKANYMNNINKVKFQLSDNYDYTKSYPQSVLYYSMQMAECNSASRVHPTQKPVGLFEYLIRTYTNENDLVFDGFGGSGTTAIAASKCNRNFIVIEKEEKYYDLAKKRLKNELAQFKLFEGLK